MPHSPGRVYRQENLRFATKAPGREPTLYFRTSHGSGRLRQQHPRGPKIQDIVKHTSHAFFATKRARKEFRRDFKRTDKTRRAFRELRARHAGKHTPIAGYHHYEASFDRHDGSGVAHTTHKSQGKVVGPRTLARLHTQVDDIYTRMQSATAHSP